jgi:predicted ribosomally synthesized peptide with SipW-like signal peptide
MPAIRSINPVLRATGVIGVVAAMVTGVTFAALNSQATLTDNTISTATVGLEVGTAANDTGASKQGFAVTGLIPGTGVDKNFYLLNTGDTPLDVTAHVPTLPGAPEGGYGFSGFENLTVDITSPDCAEDVVHTNMQALNAGEVALPCDDLPVAGEGDDARQYVAHIDIKPEAVSGAHAGVDNFDLVFTGNTATAPEEEPTP